MKCPKCGYEPTVSEAAASPDICPKCGVVYAKVLASAARDSSDSPKESGPTLSRKDTKADVRRKETEEWHRRMDEAAKRRMVVTDFDIPFGRLVWLMTKIILAALPAALLASLIVSLFGALFIGVFGGLFSS